MTLQLGKGSIKSMPATPNQLSLRLGIKPFRDILRFSGRSTRTELASYAIVYTVAIMALMPVTIALRLNQEHWLGTRGPIVESFATAYWLPAPALISRRLHDIGWRGWPGALFVALIGSIEIYSKVSVLPFQPSPALRFAGSFIALTLFLACLRDETPGTNRYGPDPRLDPQYDALEQA